MTFQKIHYLLKKIQIIIKKLVKIKLYLHYNVQKKKLKLKNKLKIKLHFHCVVQYEFF